MEVFFLTFTITKMFFPSGGFFLIPVWTHRRKNPTCRWTNSAIYWYFSPFFFKFLSFIILFNSSVAVFCKKVYSCLGMEIGFYAFGFKSVCDNTVEDTAAAACGSGAVLGPDQLRRCLGLLSCCPSHLLAHAGPAQCRGIPSCHCIQKHWHHTEQEHILN